MGSEEGGAESGEAGPTMTYATVASEVEAGWSLFVSDEVEILAFHATKGVRVYGKELSPTPENATEIWNGFSDWMKRTRQFNDAWENEANRQQMELEQLRIENARLRVEGARLRTEARQTQKCDAEGCTDGKVRVWDVGDMTDDLCKKCGGTGRMPPESADDRQRAIVAWFRDNPLDVGRTVFEAILRDRDIDVSRAVVEAIERGDWKK